MSLYLGENCISAGGSSAFRNTNIGEIIQSTIPLTDAGLHLLDGSVISGNGAYSAFYEYIVSLYSSYPQLYTDEAGWQQSVANYGVCGKFVFNTTNRTVRLPKITGFTEGTVDLTVLGDLVEAGLPNITGSTYIREAHGRFQGLQSNTGCIETADSGVMENANGGGDTDGNMPRQLKINASLSSSIYGNSSTVQPQSIKVLYYIVIATSTKTEIEVDIDEIATDLNGKADVDLSNCTKPYIVDSYFNGLDWYILYSNGIIDQGGRIQNKSTSTNVAFLKKFSNANYTITGGLLSGTASTSYEHMNFTNLTKDGFTFFTYDNYGVCWRACGK